MTPDLDRAIGTYAARPSILVATDFDGVLAPLVHDPSTSRPVPGSIEVLRDIAALPGVFVTIVSGRDLATLRQLSGVAPQEAITLIGSHGAEPELALPIDVEVDEAARERLSRAITAFEQVVDRHPGTRLEHKPAGVVLHTRGVPEHVATAASRAALAVDIPDVHLMAGKQVVEASVLDVTKGAALQALSQLHATTATCYLGDDVTDEKAFAVLPADAGHLTIKVGPGDTLAAYRIDGPDDVVAVFDAIRRRRF
ncbi:trehalose-phosphatase [Rudaeicoccus suwonensis]|uniref:Trehalose 6-phosphate phosphatase n=1 Tax=Rudaeicoccus suwonensis TaxID=657409 RepID=A0A561E7P5_9MICO|nr:trehalose-phosphatase [Rudaeicoccus suwonensis]TWE11638.1 trehalose 6-phosphatase [Rudaeicoccus suwonensis]